MSVKKSNSKSKSSTRFISSDKPVYKILLAKVKSIISILIMILKFIYIQLPVYKYTIFLKTFIYLTLLILHTQITSIDGIYSSNKEDSKGNIIKIYKKKFIDEYGNKSIKIIDNKLKISLDKARPLFIKIINILNKALNLISKTEHYIFYAIQLAIIISLMTCIHGMTINNLDFVKTYLLEIYKYDNTTIFVINNLDIKTLLNSSLSQLISIFKRAQDLFLNN